jgi:hypothetical protein
MKSWTAYQKEWRRRDEAKNPEKWKRHTKNVHFRRQYGITYNDYLALHEKQLGLCAICGNPEKLIKQGVKFDLAVDHDHVTGRIRGLLCNNCNRALGLMKDDALVLQSALDYLRRTGVKSPPVRPDA